MFVVKTRRGRDPRAWVWAMGTVVLPVLLLLGFGSGLERAIGERAAVVTVVIHPDRIQMADSVVAGEVTLEVTNRDSVPHGLAVRPVDGGEPVGKLEAPVQPGATARARMTLDAGKYRVYCPNGVDKGLLHTVTVRPG